LGVPVGATPGNLIKEMARHGEGTEYLSQEDCDRRTRVCPYQVRKGVGPVYT